MRTFEEETLDYAKGVAGWQAIAIQRDEPGRSVDDRLHLLTLQPFEQLPIVLFNQALFR